MAGCDTAGFGKEIEKVTVLSEKATEDPDAAQQLTDLIKDLQNHKVTTDLLVSTQAGKKLKKLTKHSNTAVSQAAAATVAAWKTAVSQQTAAEQNGSAAAPNGASQGSQLSSKPSQASDLEQPPAKRQKSASGAALPASTAAADATQPPAGSSSSGPAPVLATGDSTRDKARQLFSDGLQMALPEVPGGDVAFASAEVECAMHAASGGVNKDYRMKSRKLTFNIKDPRNPDLRRRVLAGDVTGEDLVNMSAEEMASDVRKSENAQIRKEALKESERGQHMTKATTDQFQCGKCRQRKTQYYQMQTRSADEPMTTFVTCVNCGNRWKFC